MSARTSGQDLFDISTRWAPHGVVVIALGDIDMLTAPVLGGTLSAIVDEGHRDVVLDLTGVAFMDAAGLGIVASTTARLHAAGGMFAVRSPGPMVRQLLDLTDFGGLVEIAPAGTLGSEQRSADESETVPSPSASAPGPDLGVTLPAGDELVDAALRLVTALAHATVGGADGVSVSLNRHGRLSTVAASDETIAQMDRHQYATGEGPCLSAAAEGHWFHVESLADEGRWPQFIPRAIEEGIGSILSTPLMVAARPAGALNIYARAARAFGPDGQKQAALLASQASAILAEAGFDVGDEAVAARLLGALHTRAVISQAQGVVMARHGVTAEMAFAALRQSSRTIGVPIRDRAREIVAGTLQDGLGVEVGP